MMTKPAIRNGSCLLYFCNGERRTEWATLTFCPILWPWIKCMSWTALALLPLNCFLGFFSLHVWPWLQTWIETFVFPVNTDFVCRVFCASRPTAHSLRCHSIDFYSQARNDFDAGTLFRVCLHYRSREAFGRSRLTCKNATNGAI